MTPNGALTAILARLNTITGMKEARSPLGVKNASSARIDRSFSVRPRGLSLSDGGGRGRSDQAGIRVASSFDIELGHILKPSDGAEAPAQALLDIHLVLTAVSQQESSLTTTAQVTLLGVTTEYVGSGAYLVQTLSVDIIFPLSLA